MRLADCDWRIRIGGLRCNPPFFCVVGRESGRVDFEVEGKRVEVPKEREPKCGLFLANVTFEPGCRNNWNIHHVTQTVNIH